MGLDQGIAARTETTAPQVETREASDGRKTAHVLAIGKLAQDPTLARSRYHSQHLKMVHKQKLEKAFVDDAVNKIMKKLDELMVLENTFLFVNENYFQKIHWIFYIQN